MEAAGCGGIGRVVDRNGFKGRVELHMPANPASPLPVCLRFKKNKNTKEFKNAATELCAVSKNDHSVNPIAWAYLRAL